MATIRPRPTTTSEAATAITASAKIWPSLVAGWRENAIRARFARVEHDLEREQDDQRAAAQQHAERADREQQRRRREVPGELGARSSAASSRRRLGLGRERIPRTTPPTAATSSTIDVISNASRWSVRKSRPISAGLPKPRRSSASSESRPPAFSADHDDHLEQRSRRPRRPPRRAGSVGPPAHGASARPPR